jgi:hypothetical protein
MIKQTKEKLVKLIQYYGYSLEKTAEEDFDSRLLEPIFDYVDVLVSRERSKIFHDVNKVTQKWHYGATKKMCNVSGHEHKVARWM